MAIPTRINGEIIFAEHVNTLRDEINKLKYKSITVKANHIAEGTYRLIIADPETSAIEITLPDPALNEENGYIVKTIETGATYSLSNTVTIKGLIDGGTDFTIEENKQSFKLISNGTTWVIV